MVPYGMSNYRGFQRVRRSTSNNRGGRGGRRHEKGREGGRGGILEDGGGRAQEHRCTCEDETDVECHRYCLKWLQELADRSAKKEQPSNSP
ncbi:hypothetical protein UPYG_G00092450 [Umbra pygmaea]|uniref:Uncharacterized protein n=1 Tax=Umbra pygmaea TaxID=75934 RepID=A0ABD0XXH5_UMBPY